VQNAVEQMYYSSSNITEWKNNIY